MLNLLRKDFIVLKSTQWLFLFFLAVFSLAFVPQSDFSFYFVAIYAANGSIMSAMMIDIKNNNHKFLVSLPVNRKHIVQAKYTVAIIYTLIGVSASYGIHKFIELYVPEINKPTYSIVSILITIVILLGLISIFMPLFYAFSKKGATIINAVFLIALIMFANPTAYYINLANENGSNGDSILLIIAAGVLTLFIASYYLTVYLFNRKDI
ncbi:ABC-2 transporter permease [Paenibacillus sp. GSMTC-2017]|uniref:ABC-2 transporter permease n=1 Tax=Paenibacillus sp. GSMTC-2017 TaxID=2794350 RepID=UPI0018D99A5A|nr:ABC-2 transporter permease [Paenibacillus sp. GSMTC-2017]MBH5319547.1 ABC-2 transporter permease [Paenibacillus sp. GSMTC-2017]